MMHRVLALYPHPADPEHFRAYYERTHIPLARTLPGLRGIRWSLGVEPIGEGAAPYFCVAELDFDDEAAVLAALQSPEGQAVVADVPNYASGGINLIHYEVRE
jgi:uncharacterized protein (TIGR02118 family)